jgi:hypothetical protein
MKKLFAMMLCIAGLATVANATTFYVDPTNGNNANPGTSWATAVKALSTVTALATANAGVDDIYVKQGAITNTVAWTLTTVTENYYGGFQGTETSPSEREMNDNDGNGIVEPWEFKYPTVYTANYNGSAIYGSAYIFDGFTITHNATKSNAAMATFISPAGGTVQNCVFSGSNLTYTDVATDLGGCLIRTIGTFKNNLVEKNIVSITNDAASTKDGKFAPILEVNTPSTSVNISINACVFRNNQVTITNPSTTAANSYTRGMIICLTGAGVSGTPSTKSTITVSNCVVYNNDATYVGNASYPTAINASILGTLPYSASNNTNEIFNCTFANNKMTNLRNACMALFVGGNVSPDYVINNATNNAFWNNQNTTTNTYTTNIPVTGNYALSSGSAQNLGSILCNNVSDVVAGGNWGTNLTSTNNLTNLSKVNTGGYSPLFKNATSVVGYTADGTVELADWRLNVGSHLIAKGIATSVLTDKAGVTFASPSAAGAYEYVADVATSIEKAVSNYSKVIQITKTGFVSNVTGTVAVISFSGQTLKRLNITVGQVVDLTSGAYLLKVNSVNGNEVVKVVI